MITEISRRAAPSRCSWPARARALIAGEKPRLAAALAARGFAMYGGDANFLFFSGPEGLAEELAGKGILIRDCSNFRGLGEGYYRIAVRLPAENDRLIAAIKEVLS